MKTYFLLVLSLFLFLGSKMPKPKYFEGIINFDVRYESKDPNTPTEAFEKYFGVKMTYWWKEGNYRKEYYNLAGELLWVRIFNRESHIFYGERMDGDSMLCYNPTYPDFSYKVIETGKEKILGMACKKLEARAIGNNETEMPKSNGAYYLAKKLKMDPSWMRLYKDGGFDQVTQKGKGVMLGDDFFGIYFNRYTRATIIDETVLSDTLFIPNQEKACKEL